MHHTHFLHFQINSRLFGFTGIAFYNCIYMECGWNLCNVAIAALENGQVF